MNLCELPNEIISSELNIINFTNQKIINGISKSVYKIITSNKSYILYIWLKPFEGNLTENTIKGVEYLFADGFDYFIHNTKLLTEIGIRVPQIIKTGYYEKGNYHYAFVEYFDGISLAEYMQKGENVKNVANKIIDIMEKLSTQKRAFYGPPMITTPNNISSTQLMYNFSIEELNISSKIDNEIMNLKDKITALLQNSMVKIIESENQSYCLIHGELTPPHIFLLGDGTIGIIDIEAIKYYDIEYDWAVIDIVFGGQIPLPNNINIHKFEFYKLCSKISYISGCTEYLANIDNSNIIYQGIRDSNLRDIKEMLV